MRTTAKAVFYLIFGLGVVRAILFTGYVACHVTTPHDAGAQECAMVHLAWRVEHGVRLYPDWRSYPHVANFYAPLNFLLVGGLGRALRASLDQLYMIGRAVTITSVTITMLVLGVFLNRRYGATAAALGMVLSVGVRPLFQAGLMCRPDALAELLGLTGFFLVGCRSGALAFAGGLSLWLAAATKQTALVYLLAGVIGLFLQAKRVRALAVLAGVTTPLLMTVLAVHYFIEPNFAACMLGEARTAADFASWWQTIRGVSLADPEFFALSAAAFCIWCRGPRKEPSLAALAALLWVSSVITAAKRGSGDNYFLGVRSIAALGAAALWDQVRATGLRPRAWHVVASAATALGMVLSVCDAGVFLSLAVMSKRLRASPQGKAIDKLYEQIYALAANPERHFLTDLGPIDIRQGDRTLYADPFRFKLMVETGQINPDRVREYIDSQKYSVLICGRDLFSPTYAAHDSSLPSVLMERARLRYEPVGSLYGLYLYGPRGRGRSPESTSLSTLRSVPASRRVLTPRTVH